MESQEEIEFTAIQKVSAIKIGNYTEVLCFLLLKEIKHILLGQKVGDFIINDLIITFYNYGGPQFCDLKLEIFFENSQIKPSIYIESKSYLNSNDSQRASSIENSVKQFLKHQMNISFGDMYMIFIPGQNNLNNTTLIDQSSKSKDLFFPRCYFQVSNDLLERNELDGLINIIRAEFSGNKSELNPININNLRLLLKKNKSFVERGNKLSETIYNRIIESINFYISDKIYEKEMYECFYEEISLGDLGLTSDEIINSVDCLFDCGTQDVSSWKENVKNYITNFLLRKYGYKKYSEIIEMINQKEKIIFKSIVDDIKGYAYTDNLKFDQTILESIAGLSSYIPFTKDFLIDNHQRKGLFYANCGDNKYYIKYDADVYLLMNKND